MQIEARRSPYSIVVILSYPLRESVIRLFWSVEIEVIVSLWMFLFHIIFNLLLS